MAVTSERQAEFRATLSSVSVWAGRKSDIVALGMAGSWARYEARMSSDVDLVPLTDEIGSYISDSDWILPATGQLGRIVRTQAWGPVIERRIELRSGFLIEFGFAPLSWASTDPIDTGTARVVSDGFRVLYDPLALLDHLVAAVGD